ncbi:hypothetical protein TRP66_22760 [Pseudomonas sp. JDS28PS106]|uniref:hypothetical protein n=1 Tax=Pseudomonas sp. JDS28PS106 TaxID=2497235 RepID=UPI002FD7924E
MVMFAKRPASAGFLRLGVSDFQRVSVGASLLAMNDNAVCAAALRQLASKLAPTVGRAMSVASKPTTPVLV